MCRLLAISIPENHNSIFDSDIMRRAFDALVSSTLRTLADDGTKGNRDGTGVCQFYEDTPNILKSAHEAKVVTAKAKYRQYMREVNWQWPLLGHVRLASVAAQTKNKDNLLPHEHAQPFMGDNITLMHNGTLRDWRWLAKKHNIADYDKWTDSWLLTQLLDKEEWTFDHWNGILSDTNGSYALIGIHKQDPRVLWIIRNKRPLYLYELDGKIQVVCTSTVFSTVLREVGDIIHRVTGHFPWKEWEYVQLDENELFTLSIKGDGDIASLGKVDVVSSQTDFWSGYEHYQRRVDSDLEVADIFNKLFQVYKFSAVELRHIWESDETVKCGSAWTTEAARKVSQFIRWCINDEERLQALATELERPIIKEGAK
jgi:predicted glutamine amidotransferase